MAPTKSRSQRKAAFEQAASAMYERLEAWYDAHADASFEELEQEVRQERRALMGETLATLIIGRDSGQGGSAPPCEKCGQALTFAGYRPWTVKGLAGDTVLARAYYVCSACVGETFFLWIGGCGCGRIIGAVGQPAWLPGWACRVSRSIWPALRSALPWGAASQALAWHG